MHKINQIEQEKAHLQEEIKTIVGVNYSNMKEKAVQTDFS